MGKNVFLIYTVHTVEERHLNVISVINDLPDNIVFSLMGKPILARTEKPINCDQCDKCFPNEC